MSVSQIEGYMGPVARQQVRSEYDAFIKVEIRKESVHSLFSFDNIVVSIEKIQPVFLAKLCEEPEDIAVDIHDIFHVSVFPQFIAIAQFDISISLSVIMFQRGKIQVLVF